AQPDAAALVGQAALGADLSGAAPRAAGALGQPGRRLRARPGRAGAAEPAALLLTGQLPEGAAAHPAAAQSRSLSGLPARLLALPPGQPRLAGDPQRRSFRGACDPSELSVERAGPGRPPGRLA